MPDRSAPLIILLISMLTACAPQMSSPPLPSTSLWGEIQDLGEAELAQAAALWVQPQGDAAAVWVGADASGVHQDARAIAGTLLSDIITLPLPPNHPYDQQLLPGKTDDLHLLWLDSASEGELRLLNALLGPGLTVERGPLSASDRLTLRYSAVPEGDGQVRVIWSGGLPAEPALYMTTINSRGIPGASSLLVRDADWPALTRANDGLLHLVWLRPDDNTLHYGRVQGDTVTGVEPVDASFSLATGDRLNTLRAAVDSSSLYIFWNVTRSSVEDQTWMTTHPLDGGIWSAAARVGIHSEMDSTIQTGLNTGDVEAVQPGDEWLEWAAPMPGQFDVLPVAAHVGDSLTVVYFQGGIAAGYQQIVPVNGLIGAPALLPDRDRYLYLAWAEPLDSGAAALRLTTSRG